MPDPEAPLAPTAEELAKLTTQLSELQKKDEQREKELLAAKLETAKVRALKDFTSVDEDILSLYNGPPEGLYEYAKKIHDKFAASSSVPPSGSGAGSHAPAPAPGPGQQVTPDQARDLRLQELREQANGMSPPNKRNIKTGKWDEAQEYYERGLGDALGRHFGRVKIGQR